MKKVIIGLIAAVVLSGCGEKDGSAFVGEWSYKGERPIQGEKILVTETDGGRYRAISQLPDPELPFATYEIVLVAENEKLLVDANDGTRKLEIVEDGTMKSFLRSEKIFTKVN